MNEGILSAIGNTPLVELTRIFRHTGLRVFAKMEGVNPGGSIKDRTAVNVIRQAFTRGDIYPGSTVIESSSGNMGIGLAQACAYFRLHFICVVDPKTTKQNIEIIKSYGAEIEMVSQPDPVTGEFLQARIDRVRSLVSSVENSFWPDQYSNIYNAKAHYQTMDEIVTKLQGRVDYLFCSTSTCGTLRGCAEYIRAHHLKTHIFAVDAIGSMIFGDQPGKRLIPGHGAAIKPPLYQENLADECLYVSDLDCIVGCRRLVREEAILAGGSSGAVLTAASARAPELPAQSICVLIFPDRGERYLDTIYSDAWVEKHFGNISRLWQQKEGLELFLPDPWFARSEF
jgi:N-(2-amino-2-carboxyethyl)-L-glutamate synthase